MSGKRSRTKGHSFERKIAKRFRDEGLYPEAKRHLETQMSEALGYDLDNTGQLYIQCKRNKGYAPISKIEEVQLENLPEGAAPVLVTKGDKKPEVVCMYLEDFIKLLKGELE